HHIHRYSFPTRRSSDLAEQNFSLEPALRNPIETARYPMFSSEAVHRYEGQVDERRSCRRATLQWVVLVFFGGDQWGKLVDLSERDRKSTRLNSSHQIIS